MAGKCQSMPYLVPTKDGVPQVPGEGSMAGECQRMLYLVPTKEGPLQVPGEGSMAAECQRAGPRRRQHARGVSEVAIPGASEVQRAAGPR